MVCESVILVLVKDFNILRVNELTLTSASVQLSGLVVRVSALRLGGLGSLPVFSLGPHGSVRLTYLLYVWNCNS